MAPRSSNCTRAADLDPNEAPLPPSSEEGLAGSARIVGVEHDLVLDLLWCRAGAPHNTDAKKILPRRADAR